MLKIPKYKSCHKSQQKILETKEKCSCKDWFIWAEYHTKISLIWWLAVLGRFVLTLVCAEHREFESFYLERYILDSTWSRIYLKIKTCESCEPNTRNNKMDSTICQVRSNSVLNSFLPHILQLLTSGARKSTLEFYRQCHESKSGRPAMRSMPHPAPDAWETHCRVLCLPPDSLILSCRCALSKQVYPSR